VYFDVVAEALLDYLKRCAIAHYHVSDKESHFKIAELNSRMQTDHRFMIAFISRTGNP
jgi:hypothetical protein